MQPSLGLILFAQATPTWTDKEVLVAVGSTIAALVPMIALTIRLLTRGQRKHLKAAVSENAKLKKELASAHSEGTKPDLADTQAQLHKAQGELSQAVAAYAAAEDQGTSRQMAIDHLQTTLTTAQASLASHQEELAAERRRIQRMLRKDGQTWTERVLANAPEFKPLEPDGRRTPIISVLNLKGGVGKTTITANLGAALDAVGYRVLLIDLDLQGSLTGLFLSEFEQDALSKQQKLLADFLGDSFDANFPNLLDYTQAVLDDRKSGLVPTTDALVYAETNLTIRWLLREGNRDPRFLLRKELQMKRVAGAYDVILLDCPPLINVCCVNALAASDYVLIPMLPSKQVTDRVPILLERLKQFRENINSNLNVLGIIANRTQRSELTFEEQNRLSDLAERCKDRWGHVVPQFDTFIRQSVEIRAAEDNHRPLSRESSMFQTFLDLARDVETHLPTFCRPSSAPSSVKEVAS